MKEKDGKQKGFFSAENDRLSVFIECLCFRVEASVGEGEDVRMSESAHQVVFTGRGGGATEWAEKSEWRSQDGWMTDIRREGELQKGKVAGGEAGGGGKCV